MIFLDTETTGLLKPSANDLAQQPYIVEIYAVKLEREGDDFKFIGEFDTLIKPPVAISEEITGINGISNAMVANSPTFAKLYPDLCEFFIGERVMVAHNIAFDAGMLRCELARLEKQFQFPWPYKQVCTIEASFPIENKKQSLSKLHALLFGAPHDNAHRARGDVEAMVRCYDQLVKRGLA